ncbi:Regulatory protein brlA [Neolecta irregularis DAH-3]|uniref:Regulatory protein brlA n=1 Tax=Neolecta irregularis (strain DAH-3) TaxID=1198029 RepID=A0A1U7LUA6_NEOID|nr:Regulatory protein brlA [Neolecta irregularis DAH-3]|eukprot:OLL26198.1 Regulatory protein brlA [Neolecta irregularis DAH-3]
MISSYPLMHSTSVPRIDIRKNQPAGRDMTLESAHSPFPTPPVDTTVSVCLSSPENEHPAYCSDLLQTPLQPHPHAYNHYNTTASCADDFSPSPYLSKTHSEGSFPHDLSFPLFSIPDTPRHSPSPAQYVQPGHYNKSLFRPCSSEPRQRKQRRSSKVDGEYAARIALGSIKPYDDQTLIVSNDDKPFPCVSCGSRFIRMEHLKRHERTHTTVKNYECYIPGCGRTFNRGDNFQAHLYTHTKQGGRNKYVPGLKDTLDREKAQKLAERQSRS